MQVCEIKTRLLQKPLPFVIIGTVYLFVMILAHWRLSFPIDALLFFLGGIIGMYLLDLAELFVGGESHPFKTMVFAAALSVCGIYVVTSATEVFAKGLVVSLTLSLVLALWTEWQKSKSFASWYSFFFGEVALTIQRIGVASFFVVFFVESLLFIL